MFASQDVCCLSCPEFRRHHMLRVQDPTAYGDNTLDPHGATVQLGTPDGDLLLTSVRYFEHLPISWYKASLTTLFEENFAIVKFSHSGPPVPGLNEDLKLYNFLFAGLRQSAVHRHR